MMGSLLLKLSPVGRILKAVPRPVWIALAVVAVLLLGTCAHKRAVKHEGDRIAKKAGEIAAHAADLSAKARKLNDETNRRIIADADDLRVRGPGKAACLNPATPGASRYVPPARKPDVAGPQVPSGDGEALLAAVPWPWLVDRGQQCDLNRAEAETWRKWHGDLLKAWQDENR